MAGAVGTRARVAASALGGDPTGGFLPIWVLKPQDMAIGFGLAALVGLIAGALPAIGASRLPIADGIEEGVAVSFFKQAFTVILRRALHDSTAA